MIKRTIYIESPSYLYLERKQLCAKNNEGVIRSAPVEDIAILMMDHPQITITHSLVRALQDNNAAIISCDEKHMPYGIMLPLVGHSEQMKAQIAQTEMTLSLKTQLWTQCIASKVNNKALVLRKLKHIPESRKLEGLMNKITINNQTEVEGYAASVYWQVTMPGIGRDRYGEPPNNYLNYGYILLRSMVARALVSAGLMPTVGINHRNRFNPYCLADDIMEPFRPFVDLIVWDITKGITEMEQFLSKDDRQALLGIATIDAKFGSKMRPLMVGMAETMASYRACLLGEKRKIIFPLIPM